MSDEQVVLKFWLTNGEGVALSITQEWYEGLLAAFRVQKCPVLVNVCPLCVVCEKLGLDATTCEGCPAEALLIHLGRDPMSCDFGLGSLIPGWKRACLARERTHRSWASPAEVRILSNFRRRIRRAAARGAREKC